ncbi:protein asteroid [Rhagoletis pomonella]|uniref:protein asteroid n=1 Tax=Rhagoletis pomonella TaxID=28610 RepID=UPI00177BA331|nr:protein asteroid [Rhagoletis pomonella]
MGVRGLTGYIARHAEQYLLPYELHDCNLVIDGDSLSCNLYKDVSGSCSAFGGDYDDFYRAVVEFFQVLAECNIEPYVLMDGGYERRKLRTAGKRLRGKIAVIKRINPCGANTIFPLLMKEVFVDAVHDCGVPVMRCVFEADDELATLSRKLGCPVLTYDSDFYIYNVQYIPLVTLTVKAHTKRINEQEHPSIDNLTERKLRKNEAKRVEKLTKANRIVGDIQVNNVEKRGTKKGKTYKFLDCCIYRIEHLIARRSLCKEKLPLFAAMLGNDYIARSSFRNFFAAGMGKAGRSRKVQQQQKRIQVILQWLKDETVESARKKIFSRLCKEERKSLLRDMKAAISGYSNEKCLSYDFFVSKYENSFQRYPPKHIEDKDGENSEEFGAEIDDHDEQEGNTSVDGEYIEEEDSGDVSDNEGNSDFEEEYLDKETNNESEEENKQEDNDADEKFDDEVVESEENIENEARGNISTFPIWFLEKLYPAHLPRYFVDLVYLRKYINSPQIEHFPYPDCNEIALPILIYSFTLINRAVGEETQPKLDENGDPLPIEFTYMARKPRVTNINYTRYALDSDTNAIFTPTQPDPLLLRHVFKIKMSHLDAQNMFEKVQLLPKDLQLYFLAIIYWLHKSQTCDLIHLHALLISVVVLRTIDSKIPAERDLREFHRHFGKILRKERVVRETDSLKGKSRAIREDLLALPVPERMEHVPKSDCYLVMEGLLKHFHMQELFKRKYDTYSTTVLHAFAEFQSIVFQLYGLNGLLDMPYVPTKMGQLFCGVFIYNMYDLLKTRTDIAYHVRNFIFRDSQMMVDFYEYLWQWCDEFVPQWKRPAVQPTTQAVNKKALKKKRQAARKQAAAQENADPNADMVDHSGNDEAVPADGDEFYDLNNKFSTFLKVR